MNEQYPWNQKYTNALNTGVRIGKVLLVAEATAHATGTVKLTHSETRRWRCLASYWLTIGSVRVLVSNSWAPIPPIQCR